MNRVLVACDDEVFQNGNVLYAKNQERYDFYCRYLRIFDSVRLLCRCIKEDSLKNGRIALEGNRFFVTAIDNYNGPKEYAFQYFKIGKQLRRCVEDCNAAVLRLPCTLAQRVYPQVKKKGIPYAVEVVCDSFDYFACETRPIHKLLWKIVDKQVRNICYNADAVSCVTEMYLQKRYYSKKPHSFTGNYSSASLSKDFYTEPRNYPNSMHLVIAHTANQVDFDGRKGHKELIKALSLLKEKGVIVNVKFAGDDYRNGIAQLAQYANTLGVSEQVSFVGYLNRQQLSGFLEESDLFVLPTRAEGLPRVLIEAMAKGLPCVSTKVSGIPELLSPPYLVDYFDVKSLADVICRLVTEKEEYETASEQNFNNSLKYEASILEKRRDEFYSSLKSMIK